MIAEITTVELVKEVIIPIIVTVGTLIAGQTGVVWGILKKIIAKQADTLEKIKEDISKLTSPTRDEIEFRVKIYNLHERQCEVMEKNSEILQKNTEILERISIKQDIFKQ